jgi:sortase B
VSKSKIIVSGCVILLAAAIGIFLFLNFYDNTYDNDNIDIFLESAAEEQTEPTTATQEITAEPETLKEETEPEEPEIEIEEEPEPEEVIEEEIKEIRTPVKANRKYQDKFDLLRAHFNNNEDIIGIVKVPGTVIFYPVAYYPEDNNYYLDRNYFKQRSAAGSIFMDYENSVERQDPNTVLYGHQMSSNSMFHSIGYFKDENYFNAHRYVIFNTVYEDGVWEVFAFLEADVTFNYIKVYFNSERDFLKRAREIREKAYHRTDAEIGEGDRILIMSTCTNRDPMKRYVLAARLIKNKEDIPEDILSQMSSAVYDYLGR